MRKHATEHGSSFDMLLDTMCNTFGGIVFIALLLAILSGSVRRNDGRRGTVDDVSAGAGSTEIEVASLKRDVEKLLTAVDTLHQALSTSSEDEHTASHLLSELNVANRAIREKVAAITVTNANLLREEASVSGENETMVASVEALKAALIAIRSEHERQRTSSRREVRLPRVHAGGSSTRLATCRGFSRGTPPEGTTSRMLISRSGPLRRSLNSGRNLANPLFLVVSCRASSQKHCPQLS
jgi:hypothetical protein